MHQNSSPAGVDPREGSLGESAISDEPTDRKDSTESAQGSSPHNPDGPVASPEPPADLSRQLALYTLARLGLFVVLAVILILAHVPLVVAPVIAIVVALPLSMLLFRNWSQRVSAGLALRSGQRRATRDQLRARLRGEFSETDADEDTND